MTVVALGSQLRQAYGLMVTAEAPFALVGGPVAGVVVGASSYLSAFLMGGATLVAASFLLMWTAVLRRYVFRLIAYSPRNTPQGPGPKSHTHQARAFSRLYRIVRALVICYPWSSTSKSISPKRYDI